MAAVEFDAIDALLPAAAAKLSHLRELADDRHGAAMGARERLEAIRENRQKLQGTISSTRNMRGYQNSEHLAKLEADLKQLEAKMRKANDAYAERSARWTAVSRVVQRIDAYIGDLPTSVAIKRFAGPAPKPKGTPADVIATCRARVEQIRAAMITVDTAPPPSADLIKKALEQVDDLARRGEPDLSLLFANAGGVEYPMTDLFLRVSGSPTAVNGEVADTLALLAWLHRDALRKKVAALITEQADDEAAIAPADKSRRLDALRADLLAVERLECAAVEAAGTDDYRADTDPRALLGLADALPAPREP